MQSGIYSITSPSGNQYIGSSANIARRWRTHLCDLRKGRHHSPALQNAFDKYGEQQIIFAVLVACGVDVLLDFEQRAIDTLRPEYNVAQTAGNRLGVKHTPETREKIRAAHAGKTQDPAHVAKRAAANRNRSQESRAKMAEMGRGRKLSDEAKAKISVANTGRVRTLEQRAAMALAGTGRKHTEETKAKMREARKSVVMPPVSDETRAKLSAMRKGVPKSEAHKAAMRAAAARRRALQV